MTRTTARLVRLTGGLIAGTIILTGCSDSSGGSSAGSSSAAESPATEEAKFNDADVAFAQGMIPHHEGALTMSEVAAERATDPRVVDLADRIEAGQDPEIDLLTGWLEEWGEPLESNGMGGMDHGSDDMGGMDMKEMPAAGPEFDRMWLQSMIEHHRGAVEMAQTELEDGRNTEALELAQLISETQMQEIAEMEALLSELGG
ncbi:DUF305 domain-containing protein [Blastococcus sp. MG754426]|uniref:DUF305 domain-containing protein n=1 Tax=unclassified Blastococcus TaxID=2619396 RepID=UPI000DEB3262|nr:MULTISPECIES: DUF305 domain-containing protein [unclassified Blastococcus]MCF6508808.1 DUF305 domain-containing protein [Blastococcus sp. MG754426]MCF6513493.1 DUF305 domain-containing protein [Blastococcus sp. MG754427]MCF6736130.1 DUF305 domain-containing protein [Blastococcus sp. KM273129]RBY92502.1 DUF305 domain-containing protein [Blastococcus sp. TF02-8]